MEFTALQIAQMIGGRVEGDENARVSTFAKIEEGVEGAISFYYDPKFQGDQFIARDTDFSIANVTSVTSDKVYIASEGREVSIAKSRIRYVVSR